MSLSRPHVRPTRRNPASPQPEICELCGNLVERARLVVSDVEGLRGYAICDFHPFEAKARSQPSHRDYRRYTDRSSNRTPRRIEPFGGELWYEKDPNA